MKLSKKNDFTSCLYLIDDSNSCNQVQVENIVIETCLDEIALENELIKHEAAPLGKALYDKKEKPNKLNLLRITSVRE
jgi:hypothetical protein